MAFDAFDFAGAVDFLPSLNPRSNVELVSAVAALVVTLGLPRTKRLPRVSPILECSDRPGVKVV